MSTILCKPYIYVGLLYLKFSLIRCNSITFRIHIFLASQRKVFLPRTVFSRTPLLNIYFQILLSRSNSKPYSQGLLPNSSYPDLPPNPLSRSTSKLLVSRYTSKPSLKVYYQTPRIQIYLQTILPRTTPKTNFLISTPKPLFSRSTPKPHPKPPS